MNRMRALGEKIARALGFDRAEDDLVTREIASAKNENEAIRRVRKIVADCGIALRILARTDKGPR